MVWPHVCFAGSGLQLHTTFLAASPAFRQTVRSQPASGSRRGLHSRTVVQVHPYSDLSVLSHIALEFAASIHKTSAWFVAIELYTLRNRVYSSIHSVAQ